MRGSATKKLILQQLIKNQLYTKSISALTSKNHNIATESRLGYTNTDKDDDDNDKDDDDNDKDDNVPEDPFVLLLLAWKGQLYWQKQALM